MSVNWKTKYQYQDDTWDALEGVLSGLAQSVFSGVLLYLSFPPVSWWMLAWVALVPMMKAHQQTFPDEAAWLAQPVAMVTFLALHFNKVSVGFALGAETLPPLVRALFRSKSSILATLFVSVALLSALSRSFQRQTRWRHAILESVLFWMTVDYVRDSIPVLGTSASFAYSQFKVVPIVRTASLVGTAGLTAAIVAVNAALTALLLARFRDDRGYLWKDRAPEDIRCSLVRQAGVALAAVLSLVACSSAGTFASSNSPATAVVGLVQPCRNLVDEEDQGIGALRELTRQAATLGARIVVWPEASFRDDPRTQGIWADICRIASDTGSYLVVPYFTEAPTSQETTQDKPRFINEGLFVSPAGEVLGAGAKDHPVSLLGETSVTRGRYPVFDTPCGRVGVMICYDLNFTDTARRLALSGAQIICVPSNDWEAISQAQYMYAVFRAAENGACVLKADTNFDSCIVSPDGRIVRQAVDPAGTRAVLVAGVTLRSSPPPAAHLGSLPGLLSFIAWTGLMGWSRVKPRRQVPTPGDS